MKFLRVFFYLSPPVNFGNHHFTALFECICGCGVHSFENSVISRLLENSKVISTNWFRFSFSTQCIIINPLHKHQNEKNPEFATRNEDSRYTALKRNFIKNEIISKLSLRFNTMKLLP